MPKQRGLNVRRTLVDRAVSYFSPERGLRRIQARAALERAVTFEGATKGRRTKNWKPGNESINSAIVGSLPTLRARSRDLVRNNAWAFGAVDSVVSETIGAGIIPRAIDDDAKLVAAAEKIWTEWGDTTLCDSDAMLDFYGIQSLVMKTIVEAGSVLIRKRSRRMSDGLPIPLQLQVLEPEYLDVNRDTYAFNDSGEIVLGGIVFDRLGRRKGYWIYREPPGSRQAFLKPLDSVFVPAADIIHIFRVDRAGQVDGVPWGAPVIIRLRDLDEYEDAELVKQKVAACHVAAVTRAEPLEDMEAKTDAERAAIETLEPGAVEYFQPGESITFSNPPQSNNDKHVPWQLRAIARSYGVTYEACTGDYSQVNFSSGRMGRLQMLRNVDRWQQQLVIPRLCRGVWAWTMDAAIVAGLLPRPVGSTWTVPRREMIDPGKETLAIQGQIRSGLITLSEAIRASGREPEDVFAERAADNAKLDELGIILDSDPRQRSSIGFYPGDSAAAKAAGGAPEKDDEESED